MELPELLEEFEGVSLKELDHRAALLRRVDTKYAVTSGAFVQLAERLRADHQLLDIDGRRMFSYATTYFDTPDLRCFVEHVEGRVPRFKARTRLYEDSGQCVFEVKLKRSEDQTDKRQIGYSPEDQRRLTDAASECVRDALRAVGLDTPRDFRATLTTSFQRLTFAARDGAERLTCDFGVRLIGSDDSVVAMDRGLILLETKSESGNSPADRELHRMDVEPISLSKYRVGISTVGGTEGYGNQPGSELFGPLTRA